MTANTDVDALQQEYEQLEAAAKGSPTILAIQQSRYKQIDIAPIFNQLLCCINLLKLTHQSAADMKCSTEVLKCMSKYQTMIHESGGTTLDLFESCKRALKVHEIMKKYFEKGMADKGYHKCDELSRLAKKNSDSAMVLRDKVKALIMLVENALVSAKHDSATEKAENKRVAVMIEEAQKSKKALEESLAKTATALAEVRKEERTQQEIGDSSRDKQFSLDIGNVIMGGLRPLADEATGALGNFGPGGSMLQQVTNLTLNKVASDITRGLAEDLGSKAEAANEAEKKATAARRELEDQWAAEKAKLVSVAEQLKTMKAEKSEIERVFFSVVACLQLLGQIKISFQMVSQFWDNMSRGYDTLKDTNTEGFEFNEEVQTMHKQSVCSWAALGRINLKGWRMMTTAVSEIDAIMKNLTPLSDEEVAKLANDMKSALKQGFPPAASTPPPAPVFSLEARAPKPVEDEGAKKKAAEEEAAKKKAAEEEAAKAKAEEAAKAKAAEEEAAKAKAAEEAAKAKAEEEAAKAKAAEEEAAKAKAAEEAAKAKAEEEAAKAKAAEEEAAKAKAAEEAAKAKAEEEAAKAKAAREGAAEAKDDTAMKQQLEKMGVPTTDTDAKIAAFKASAPEPSAMNEMD